MNEPRNRGNRAKVDSLVGEGGYKITVPEDSSIGTTGDPDQSVGGTGPSGWWRYGLAAIAVIALVVLVIQIFGSNPATPPPAAQPTASAQ